MAKTIVVHVKQVIDGEVSINYETTFHSEEEFEKARKEAVENWEGMQGRYAQCPHGKLAEPLKDELCLNLTVDGSYDYEKWSVVDIIEDKPNLWDFGDLSTAVQCAGALVREARASHKKIPYEQIGYALRTILKDIGDTELGKQLAALDK